MSTQIDKKVLDKIRKLLAKANDPAVTQEEMEAFLTKAQSLSMKHNIDSASVELDMSDIGESDVKSNWNKAKESKSYEVNLLSVIARNYNCRVVIFNRNEYDYNKMEYKAKYTVYGKKEDVAIVIEMFAICSEKFRTFAVSRNKEYRKNRVIELNKALGSKSPAWQYQKDGHMSSSNMWIKSYLDGTTIGLRQKFKIEKEDALNTPEAKEKWGLIVVKVDDLTDAYIKENVGRLRTSKQRQTIKVGDAMSEGIRDGKSNHTVKQLT